jgi:hypothetical protein
LGRVRVSRQHHRGSRRRLLVEPLEERALLSTWIVNSLGDSGTGSGSSGDLRYCLTQANQTTGDNTINFSVTGTITLDSALPSLNNATGLLDIEGPGAASLTVARNSAPGTPLFRIFSFYGNAKVAGLTITGGLSSEDGGGIRSVGNLTVTGCTVANNGASTGGGGISAYGPFPFTPYGSLNLSDCIVANNSTARDGGGIEVFNDVPLTVVGCNIDYNSAQGSGGGVYGAALSMSGCTVAYNSAYLAGGGVRFWLPSTISSSTIAYNAASHGDGGGIDKNYGPLTLTNSTVAFNSSPEHTGGGLYNYGPLTVSNCTIAYNSAHVGGGIGSESSTILLNNTLVVSNSDDVWTYPAGGVSSSSACNLIGTGGSGGLVDGVNGNQVGVAHPGLDSGLADNGGPTQTIALLSGSHAIDRGSNALAVDPATGHSLNTDQRGAGFARIVGDAVDVGAFEVQSTDSLVIVTQPPVSLAAGTAFGLTATAKDKSGSVDTSFSGTVVVSLAANPGGGTLAGTLTVTAKNGVAEFTDLTLGKAAAGYTLRVSSAALPGATSNSFDVTPAAATQFAVTSQPPPGVTAGSSFGLIVSAEDPYGNVDPSFAGEVAVSVLNNPGGAILSGTLSKPAPGGVAIFTDLALDQVGVGYVLQVTADGLGSAATSAFNVQTSIASSVGVNWGTSGSATLTTNADGLRLLATGRNTDLPWLGINQIRISLAQGASLTASDITVLGSSGTSYGPVTLSGSGTSYTIILAQPINGPDRVTITIGNALIANFTRRLDVLPGDFNDDGVVNSQDMVGIRNQIIGFAGALPTIFGDINGDGVVDAKDYTAVRNRLGTHL